jgi:hypothetical protein
LKAVGIQTDTQFLPRWQAGVVNIMSNTTVAPKSRNETEIFMLCVGALSLLSAFAPSQAHAQRATAATQEKYHTHYAKPESTASTARPAPRQTGAPSQANGKPSQNPG